MTKIDYMQVSRQRGENTKMAREIPEFTNFWTYFEPAWSLRNQQGGPI